MQANSKKLYTLKFGMKTQLIIKMFCFSLLPLFRSPQTSTQFLVKSLVQSSPIYQMLPFYCAWKPLGKGFFQSLVPTSYFLVQSLVPSLILSLVPRPQSLVNSLVPGLVSSPLSLVLEDSLYQILNSSSLFQSGSLRTICDGVLGRPANNCKPTGHMIRLPKTYKLMRLENVQNWLKNDQNQPKNFENQAN